jgi:putative ABC transport system permease protein
VGSRAELASGPCTVRGIISSGGAEDNQFLLPIERVSAEAGLHDAVSLVQVRAEGSHVEQVRAALAAALPQTDIRLLYAVAETEANVVLKVRTALFLLTGLILAIAVLCVSGNFSTLVMERSREIGILKAIGAGDSRIAGLFLAESVGLALAAAVTGYLAGAGVTSWISGQIFSENSGAVLILSFRVFAQAAAITLAVAILATVLPASRIWRIQAAATLRGE